MKRTPGNIWTVEFIRSATGGRYRRRPIEGTASETESLAGLSIDSRTVNAREVFVAIRGRHHDGHDHIMDAAQRGAGLIVIEEGTIIPGELPATTVILEVENTTVALGRIAASHRRTLTSTRIIAITGSSGKTSTKQLLDAVLSTSLRGRSSPRSFNNEIGVPLTLLSARSSDQYLIVEIGTNAPGEIAYLSALASPDIALITTIGPSHLEGLASIDGVLQEKASLLQHLEPGGWAVLPGDVPGLPAYAKHLGDRVTWFGHNESADLRLSDLTVDRTGVRFSVNERMSWYVPLFGAHQAMNALAAIAVARRLGMTEDQIHLGLSSAHPVDMRFTIDEIGPWVVINDAYNANPQSMTAALRTVQALSERDDASLSNRRRIFVLGDMRELGAHSARYHAELAAELSERLRFGTDDEAVLIGVEMASCRDALLSTLSEAASRTHHHVELTGAVIEEILVRLSPGDLVVVKGSRSIGLERVIEAIVARAAGTSPQPPEAAALSVETETPGASPSRGSSSPPTVRGHAKG